MDDKRKFARFKLSVEVRWEKATLSPDETVENVGYGLVSPNTGQARDISAGGICLILTGDIQVGDILQLVIKLPGALSIRSVGRVVWIDKNTTIGGEDNVGSEAGVQFLDLSDANRKEISRYLLNLSRDWEG